MNSSYISVVTKGGGSSSSLCSERNGLGGFATGFMMRISASDSSLKI